MRRPFRIVFDIGNNMSAPVNDARRRSLIYLMGDYAVLWQIKYKMLALFARASLGQDVFGDTEFLAVNHALGYINAFSSQEGIRHCATDGYHICQFDKLMQNVNFICNLGTAN